MKHLKRCVLVSMLVVALTTLLTAGLVQAAGLTGAKWSIVPSPNAGSGNGYLKGVATVSANDIWAVGYYYTSSSYTRTLIEHWNGSGWQVIPSPNPGRYNQLRGVAAVSATDIWAVGQIGGGSVVSQPLIEHWDGSSWQVVPGPHSGYNFLNAVAAVSATDIWAVGTWIEHWNGSNWQVIPSPNVGGFLYGVAAISTNNVWAVGDNCCSGATTQTVVKHWNGSSWKVVSSPNVPGSGDNTLKGVAAVSATDIWAVGAYAGGIGIQTLTEHWNGTSWKIVKSPNVSGSDADELYGVAAVSATDIWAVGYSHIMSGSNINHTLTEHWNGTSWKVVSSPDAPGSLGNNLYGVAAVSANDIWAVGSYESSNVIDLTLIEFYD